MQQQTRDWIQQYGSWVGAGGLLAIAFLMALKGDMEHATGFASAALGLLGIHFNLTPPTDPSPPSPPTIFRPAA